MPRTKNRTLFTLFTLFAFAFAAGTLLWQRASGASLDVVPRARASGAGSSGERDAPVRSVPDAVALADGCVGVVLPAQASDLTAARDGKVEQVHVALGDHVEVGQLLVSLSVEQARLERVRGEADYAAATSALARAQVEREHASVEAARAVQLQAEGLTSKEAAALASFKLQQSRILAAEAESLRKERGARAAQLRAVEQDTSIRATFRGRVATRYVDTGANVVGGTPLLRVISEGPLILRFATSEQSSLRDLRVGDSVRATPSEGKRPSFQATVVRLAPEIDSASRMRTVEATVDAPEELTSDGLIGSIVNVQRASGLRSLVGPSAATVGGSP